MSTTCTTPTRAWKLCYSVDRILICSIFLELALFHYLTTWKQLPFSLVLLSSSLTTSTFTSILSIILESTPFLNVTPYYSYHGVANLCADLNSTGISETDALARWVQHVFTGEFCLDVSFDFRAFEASLTSWEDIFDLSWTQGLSIAYPFISRPLFYLRCTQLGLFPTSVNARSSFGHAIGQDVWFYGCNEAFGAGYDYTLLQSAIDQLQFQYGGKNPTITNAIFTNGELDSLYSFGITESDYPSTYVRNIPSK